MRRQDERQRCILAVAVEPGIAVSKIARLHGVVPISKIILKFQLYNNSLIDLEMASRKGVEPLTPGLGI